MERRIMATVAPVGRLATLAPVAVAGHFPRAWALCYFRERGYEQKLPVQIAQPLRRLQSAVPRRRQQCPAVPPSAVCPAAPPSAVCSAVLPSAECPCRAAVSRVPCRVAVSRVSPSQLHLVTLHSRKVNGST